MREIAATFDASGLPAGFFTSAAEIYAALEDCRDNPAADLANAVAILTRRRD
jgi:hypothetical protein